MNNKTKLVTMQDGQMPNSLILLYTLSEKMHTGNKRKMRNGSCLWNHHC